MSQRAATRGFFLCILAVLTVLPFQAWSQVPPGITFSPSPVAFAVGEISPVVTATVQYGSTTPPTGTQTLTFVGGSGISAFPTTVSFLPPAPPATSVQVQFQLVAAPNAIPGSGQQLQVNTLGITGSLLTYDLTALGITPSSVTVFRGATTGPVSATVGYVSTPPGTPQQLSFAGLPAGAVPVPSPVTFTPTGFSAVVNFAISTSPTTPTGSFTVTVTTTPLATGTRTFTLFVQAPPTLTVVPGSASISACASGPPVPNSLVITVGGFQGSLEVTFPNLPAGLTVTPTPPIAVPAFPGSQTVNFQVSASVDAAPGLNTVNVLVQDLFAGLSASTSFAVNVGFADFAPVVSPASIVLLPGGASATVFVSANASLCPLGSSLFVTPGSIPPSLIVNPDGVVLQPPTFQAQTFSIAASGSASPGTFTVRFTFSADGGPVKTGTLQVVVRSPGALSATVEKPTMDLCPGGAALPNSITVTPLDGYTGTPAVTFLGVPTGLAISPFSVAVPELPPAQTVSFTVAAAANMAAGSYEIAARVRDDSGVSTVVNFVVNVVTDGFSTAVAPSTITLDAGGPPAEVTATVASIDCGKPPASVTITPTGLPAGVTATPPSIVVTGPPYAPAVFTFAATGSTPVGNVAVTFTFAPSAGAPRTVTLPVTVVRNGRIGVAVERASMDVCPGGAAGANTLTLSPVDGYTGSPTVTFPSLPAGLTATPTEIPAPAMPPAQVVPFQLTAAAGTAPGPLTVTVLVSDPRGMSTTATFVANVLPPDFTATAAPSPVTLNAGGAAATISASLVAGSCAPTSGVTVTPSGLPPGVTVTPESAVLAPPSFPAAPFSFRASSSAASGPTTVTFTFAAAGGVTKTATAVITVCGPPAPAVSPVIQPQGNLTGPVTATDFLALSWIAPATGFPATRYEWRLNGGAWASTTSTSAAASPRGTLDPLQLFVRGFACDPEKGPGAEAASVVYPLAAPTASFSVPSSIVAGRPVTFTDTSSPQATSWLWFPGDGLSATTVQSPTITFPSAGQKVVVLVATNGSGSSSKSTTLNVLPASAVRAEAGLAVRALDRQPDGRLALDRIDVAAGTTLVLRRLEGEGETVAFLRFLDGDGRVVVERRLVLAAGEEARHDLSAFAAGAFRVEVVGPEDLEAVVEERAVPFGGPETPVTPRQPRRVQIR